MARVSETSHHLGDMMNVLYSTWFCLDDVDNMVVWTT